MRFEIGQKIYTIGLQYSDSDDILFTPYVLPLVLGNAPSVSIILNELTVREHHKVPGEWDDNPVHDGFILADEAGNHWNNQYPRAAYGQITTTSDYRFDRRAPELSSLADLRKELNGKPYEVESLSTYLEDLESCIFQRSKMVVDSKVVDQPEKYQAVTDKMIEHRNSIINQFEKQFEKKVKISEYIPKRSTGVIRAIPGMFRVTFE